MNRPAQPGRRSLLTGLGAALALAADPARADSPPARLRIGDAVPDLQIATAGGDTVRLGALRGRVLIINFFASYCGPCRTELPLLGQLTARLAAAARTHPPSPQPLLLPVGVDERPADAAQFARSLGVTTPVLVDPQGVVRTAFSPDRYPCTFLVDAAGVVRHINRGFGAGYLVRVERWLRALLALPPLAFPTPGPP